MSGEEGRTRAPTLAERRMMFEKSQGKMDSPDQFRRNTSRSIQQNKDAMAEALNANAGIQKKSAEPEIAIPLMSLYEDLKSLKTEINSMTIKDGDDDSARSRHDSTGSSAGGAAEPVTPAAAPGAELNGNS